MDKIRQIRGEYPVIFDENLPYFRLILLLLQPVKHYMGTDSETSIIVINCSACAVRMSRSMHHLALWEKFLFDPRN